MKYFTKLLTIFTIFTISLAGCQQGPEAPDSPCADAPGGSCDTPVTLTIWHVFEDRDVYEPLIEQYTDVYKNVTISYKKIEYTTYEEKLINAIAAGEGPDIFHIHNDWLPKHNDKISPMPQDEAWSYNLDSYREYFVDVAADDLIYQDNIYGIPLYVDTPLLYYNSRLLDDVDIYSPPVTWQQLVDYSHQLTQLTPGGNIIQSGITMGTANNVNRASDILYSIMLQNKTNMMSSDRTSANFALPIKTSTSNDFYPGLESLKFYTGFSDPDNLNYCWNHTMIGSLEAFEKGYAAMTINYSYQKPIIDKFKDPTVRYQTTYFPRIETTDDPITYANYWAETVNKNSKSSAWAWHFIKFMSTNSSIYNQRTNKPTAIRDKAKDSSNAANEQSYYAQSFYKIRAQEIDDIFNQMIDDTAFGGIPAEDSIRKAQDDITSMMIKYKVED